MPILDGKRSAGAPVWFFRLFPILLFILSFVPRLAALGRYITPDESIWVYRSIQFREALLAGRWAGTLVAGHPGVTTTWLGALGMTVQLQLAPELRATYDWLTTMAYLTPDNVEAFKHLAVFLNSGRIAVALVNSLGIVGIYYLVRRLWGGTAAVVAGLFLALDPFLVGLSGLLHVDGLSATFATLSLLALALGAGLKETGAAEGRSWPWLALAGATAGLAALSKTPTLVLIPVTGLALLWPIVRDRRRPWRERLTTFVRASVTWGASFLVMVLLFYPALWSSPAAVLATVGGSANRHLDEALRETFFLGRVAFNHGPLFYPIVLLWRLSPVVWLSLIPVTWLLITRRRSGRSWLPDILPPLLLALWVVLFLTAITPAAKKFDRYILPVVPSLLILAAVAWAGWANRRPRFGRWALPLMVSAQVLFWLAFAAYPLTAYNPLVGGPRTAVRVLPVGWGEGISAAGRRLAETQPETEMKRAIAGIAPSLAPFFPGQTLVDGLDDPATADFTIVTLGGRQLDPAGFERQTAGLDLILTEHFGGLDQAWAYQRTSPQAADTPPALAEMVSFGDRMALDAYSHTIEDDTVSIATQWQRLATLSADERFTLRIAIKDREGNVWAAQENDLLNEDYFYPPDWVEDNSGIIRTPLELPPGIPPATYQVTLSLIDNRTAGQLPVRAGAGGFQGVVYEAGQIVVPPPDAIISASRMQIPAEDGKMWLDGGLQLLGHGEVPAEALAGSRLPVDLFWHAPTGTLPDNLQIDWRLSRLDGDEGEVIATEPLSRYDTGLWRTGETLQEKYQVPLPPDLTPGRYELAVEPHLPDGHGIGGPYTMAEIQINNIDRLYELPDDIPVPMEVEWGPLTLRGMGPEKLMGKPGDSPELTLYWENQGSHGEVFTAFVHVVNEAGEIVFQADHWPGGLPTDILDDGQVIIDNVPLPLPSDLPPGEYRIQMGIYSTDSGQRLPVLGAGASNLNLVEADFVTLPVDLQVTAP